MRIDLPEGKIALIRCRCNHLLTADWTCSETIIKFIPDARVAYFMITGY